MFDDFEKKYDHAEKSGEGNVQLNKMKSQFYSAHENLITIYQYIPFYSYLPTKGMYGPILFTITVNCENIKLKSKVRGYEIKKDRVLGLIKQTRVQNELGKEN